MTQLSALDGLTAADVMHAKASTLPSSATVGELRAYFAASSSRKLALLVDGERYVGCLVPSAIPDDADAASAAVEYAAHEPTIHPSAPATTARDVALAEPSQRLPVIDDGGRLVGIVAINHARDGFCRA